MAADDFYLSFLVAKLGKSGGLLCFARLLNITQLTASVFLVLLQLCAGCLHLKSSLWGKAWDVGFVTFYLANVSPVCCGESLRRVEDAEPMNMCEKWADVAVQLLDAMAHLVGFLSRFFMERGFTDFAEADASSKDRCAQGHHAKPGVSGTVPKYSRNDTLAQLRCQQHVWEKIEAGGRPMVPIDRGVSGHIILPSSSTATQRACVDGVQNTLPPSTDDDIEPSLNDAAQRDGSTTEEEEEHDDDYSSVCLSDTLDVDDSEEEIFDSGNAKLATTRIPEAVKQNILVRYDEQDLLVTCFRKESGLDAWIKSLLVTESHPIATEASWSVHPVAGMIRSLWLDACASSPGDAERGTKQDRAPTSLSLLPLFEENYPGTVLSGATLPCLGFLSRVKTQCSARAWEWAPWKKGLSEDDAIAVKSRRSKSGDLLEIMSQAAGLGQDEWDLDLDLSNAPLRVTSILTVRARAYSMCGAGHLSCWMQYVQKFVCHCAKPAAEGFRMPTALEAEMTDREVMGEVFKMAYEGITMDRALLSVMKDDLLRIHLTCKPKPFKLAKSVQNAGGAGTGKPSTATDVGLKRKRLLPRHPGAEKKYKVGFCRGSMFFARQINGDWFLVLVNCLDETSKQLSVHVLFLGKDVEFTRSLIMKDVEAGFAFILEGGREPRLISDGGASGTNGASCIPEKMRLPDLECVQRFLSEPICAEAWWMFTFDVKGAHKLVRVRDDEQGYCIFILGGVWYVYRSCYFGCRWAAYWFSRVGGWLVRLLHRFIWIAHGLFLYSDDGPEFLPDSGGPLMAVSTLMLLATVGVPISWKKVGMGHELVWIGWRFNALAGAALLPYKKSCQNCGESEETVR
ncbi:unnamed protein product [Symbiodinium microadriaticum]|nr:unnamed protein product [Symbiodinium microadriaticum]CAE7928632.1 unnamed protein product [Symbiodinium sp. KB8]